MMGNTPKCTIEKIEIYINFTKYIIYFNAYDCYR